MVESSATIDSQFAQVESDGVPSEKRGARDGVVPRKRSRRFLGMMAVAAACAALGGTYYVTHRGLEDTDDAEVDADVTAVPTQTTAVVRAVHFVENKRVKKGELLVELDDAPAKARLAEAEANFQAAVAQATAADADERVTELTARTNRSAAKAQVAGASSTAIGTRQRITENEAGVRAAQANYDKAKLDLGRGKELLASGAIPQQQMDTYVTALNTADAALSQAKARLEASHASSGEAQSEVEVAAARFHQASDVDVLIAQAKARADAAHAEADTRKAARDSAALELSYTKIFAPVDGTVSKKTVQVGQMATSGQGVALLVPIDTPWVTANFKETQLAHMRPGQPVTLSVDSLPNVELHGQVESLSAATGARFALLPPDNATGNFTKIIQRLPVRIAIRDLPSGVELRPGLSADVTVDTRR